MRISPTNIQPRFSKLLQSMGKHAFLSFLSFFLIAVLISGLVFYRYVWTVAYTEIPPVTQTKFESALFQNMLQTWERQERIYEQAGETSTRNIFAPSPAPPPQETQETAEEQES